MLSHRRYLILRSYFGHPLYKTTLSSSMLNFVNISFKAQTYSALNQKCIIINFHLPNLDMHLTLQCLQNIMCLYSRSMCLFDVRPTLHMLRFIHFLSLRWVPLAFNYFQILFSITEGKMNTNIESVDIDRNVEVLDKSIFWWEGSGHLSFYECVRWEALWFLTNRRTGHIKTEI